MQWRGNCHCMLLGWTGAQQMQRMAAIGWVMSTFDSNTFFRSWQISPFFYPCWCQLSFLLCFMMDVRLNDTINPGSQHRLSICFERILMTARLCCIWLAPALTGLFTTKAGASQRLMLITSMHRVLFVPVIVCRVRLRSPWSCSAPWQELWEHIP